jgi:NADH-quinone oxidoreductase subunit M
MTAMLEAIGWPAWVLHGLLLLPVVGAILVGTIGRQNAKQWAFAIALLEFLISVPLWFAFNAGSPAMQFTASFAWIPQWGIHYRVGVDGISVLLVLLTTALAPIAILGSFEYI